MTSTETVQTASVETTVDQRIEFAHLDPASLTIETNVRAQVDLDKDFVASIKQYGVLVPVIVVRQQDGALHVRAGQRRTLAAIEAGVATIPARIIDATGDEAARIIEQVIENDQRRALRDADRTAAFQQLSLLGVPAAQIAKRLHVKKATVENSLTVAGSPLAAAIIDKHNLTLDQALVLTEFEDDPALVKALTIVAVKEPAKFEHTAQQLRDQRAEKRARAALTADLTSAGVQVIDRPAFDEKKITALGDLRDAAGERLTAQTHATCPARAAYLQRRYDETLVMAVHVCLDPQANGHTNHSASTGTLSAPMSEDQKVERREVIAGNKAWKSAETVRRAWLAKFATRRTAPKDAALLIAHVMAEGTNDLAHAAQQGHALARDVLAIKVPDTTRSTYYAGYSGITALTDAIDAASPARAEVIALTIALCAIEARTGTHTWRNARADVARYLTALAAWGYNLSDIEQTTIDTHAAEKAARNTAGATEPAEPEADDEDTVTDGASETDEYYNGDEYEGEDVQAAYDAMD